MQDSFNDSDITELDILKKLFLSDIDECDNFSCCVLEVAM
jgi:hypothetical protein